MSNPTRFTQENPNWRSTKNFKMSKRLGSLSDAYGNSEIKLLQTASSRTKTGVS